MSTTYQLIRTAAVQMAHHPQPLPRLGPNAWNIVPPGALGQCFLHRGSWFWLVVGWLHINHPAN